MSKGLDLILEKIKGTPSQTLVGRYLALISELPEPEKMGRALDLAEVLVVPKPVEAMRIAHMVHRIDRDNVRAMNVLIEALTAKGRLGKAEVLRLERDKVLGRGVGRGANDAAAADGVPTVHLGGPPAGADQEWAGGRLPDWERAGGRLPAAVGRTPRSAVDGAPGVSRRPLGASDRASPAGERGGRPVAGRAFQGMDESSAAPELDLDAGDEVSLGRQALDHLFPSDPSAPVRGLGVQAVAEGGGREDAGGFGGRAAMARLAYGGSMPPGDTVLPFSRSAVAPPAAQASARPQGNGFRVPPPASGPTWSPAVPPAVPPPAQRSGSAPEAPPEVAMSGFGAVVELFDHFWRQGFVGEARELLRQAAPVAGHEPWWLARNALIERSQLPTPASSSVAAAHQGPRPPVPQPTPTKPMPPEEFWKPLQVELGRLSQSARKLLVPLARVERLKVLLSGSPRGRALPEAFVRTLVELDHRLPGVDANHLIDLQWNLLQGLWGAAPDGACAAVLEELEVCRSTPGFWGFYLDALVASGAARKALVEIRRGLEAKPLLSWARVAWGRLPAVWAALRVHGFTWREDDGVPALLKLLAERPRPMLAAMIAVSRET